MQFPQNTNLHFFLQNKTMVDIPLEDISDIMLKVSRAHERYIILAFDYYCSKGTHPDYIIISITRLITTYS